ncbi:pentapeptide repeat-containing protein [Georgenia muralis]
MTGTPGELVAGGVPTELTADCLRCVALCCVALPLVASADFAIDKAPGVPCLNLRADLGCGIHARLREEGFPGCTVYDCFGAGQKVARLTYGGRDWRDHRGDAEEMFAVFAVVRQLHEMLRHLDEARRLAVPPALADEADRAFGAVDALTRGAPGTILALDVAARRGAVGELLERVSAHVRRAYLREAHMDEGRARRARDVPAGRDLRRADLVGARLAGTDLRGADLRGALLVAADLRGADLRAADVLGADLRGARLAGADLREALFLTGPQLAAAQGDGATRVAPHLGRPEHWGRDVKT